MGEAFENWFKNEMLPAECDDERVMVGMRLCWDDRQAEIDRLKEEVREQKELVQMILAEGYKTRQRLLHKHGVEIIVHESKEVQGE